MCWCLCACKLRQITYAACLPFPSHAHAHIHTLLFPTPTHARTHARTLVYRSPSEDLREELFTRGQAQRPSKLVVLKYYKSQSSGTKVLQKSGIPGGGARHAAAGVKQESHHRTSESCDALLGAYKQKSASAPPQSDNPPPAHPIHRGKRWVVRWVNFAHIHTRVQR